MVAQFLRDRTHDAHAVAQQRLRPQGQGGWLVNLVEGKGSMPSPSNKSAWSMMSSEAFSESGINA